MSHRRVLAALSSAVLLLALAACGDEKDDSAKDSDSSESHAAQPENPDGAPCQYPEGQQAARDVDPPADTAAYTGQVPVTIETSAGDIPVTLDADTAPCTVNSFTSLASQGFYDDTECHRLTTAGIFVLQCGDPTATGTGGPGYSFPDELSGTETYSPGTLAMANAGPDTNGSQFFLVYEQSPLPPAYTVFGTVSEEGLQVLQEIAAGGSDDSNAPGDGKPKTEVDIDFVEVGDQGDLTSPSTEVPTSPSIS
jgi:peptidyl-prolyl cis-trans isomerase B (cyclophilin B)